MSDDLLDRLQTDVHGVLMATPSLALAHKINDNKGDLEGELETALATISGTSGKSGLAVIVLAPEVDGVDENLPGPPLEMRVMVQCIELVELNRSLSDGTLIRTSTAATRVLGALHHTLLGSHVLYADKKPIHPLPMRPGFVAHLVTVRCRLNGLATNKVLPVSETWDDGAQALLLSCATPDAVIYYTVDGSFPGEANEAALLYDGPISGLIPGTEVRASAYAPEMNPGDVLQLTITE